MVEPQTALATIYQGWDTYQEHLTQALASLSAAQLALWAAPNLRSIGELAAHIVGGRAFWFHDIINEGSDETAPLTRWQDADAPAGTAAELVSGFEATRCLIQGARARWTPEEMARPFQVVRGDRERTFTRQWIIWHLIEHDLHHGGELAFSLGMHGLPAPGV